MTDLIIFLALLTLGYGFGRYAENKHYKSILEREKAFLNLPAIAIRRPLEPTTPQETTLVTGSVVISIDYFKKFLSSIRLFIGGRLTSYESLIDRARREAILRMKEEARKLGAEAVINVKIETSSISKGSGKSIGSVEVLAYGTAMIPLDQ